MTMGSMQHAPWMTERYFERGAGIAALRPDWHVVMAAGQQPIPPGLDQSRPNLSVRAYVPQLKLLRRASAVVNHGGFNTVKETLTFGVPMVVLPTQSEQPGIAARVEHHGLGKRASMEHATPEQLVALLEEVLTRPEYRRAAQAMGGRLRDMERTASIADTLESFLSSREPRLCPPLST
jgi:MGT family glycosyltransferase